MKSKFLTLIALLFGCFVVLLSTTQPGQAQLTRMGLPGQPSGLQAAPTQAAPPSNQGIPLGCAIQPERHSKISALPSAPRPTQVPLSRFRQISNLAAGSPAGSTVNLAARSPLNRPGVKAAPAYMPKEEVALADSTNYGDRYINDFYGRLANHDPIVVLHETVGSASSAINFFQTPHPNDDDQVSYHTLIGQDGTVYYLVPPDKRAFGAGDSIFTGSTGPEAVQTNPDFPPSVNNFAYHISLETPADGDNNNDSHSGYTDAQYQSLAWLVAKTNVPNDRITFHKIVDRSGSRKDPRSFNTQTFLSLLNAYPKTQEIVIGCSVPLAHP